MRIVVAEDDQWYAEFIKYTIGLTGDHEVSICSSAGELYQQLHKAPDVISLDFNLPDAKGDAVVKQIRSRLPDAEIIVISGQDDVEIAVDLMRDGVHDYIVKNDTTRNRLVQAVVSIEERLRLKHRIVSLENEVRSKYEIRHQIISRSPAFDPVYRLIEKACESDINVSVLGETGTGKELVAKAIHFNSSRSKHPFIAVNLAALPESLIESELFGFVKGAFTGADRDRKGKFEETGKGTIFLDEIAEINHNIQVKLLRVLQEMQITPVGSNKNKEIQVRIIVATNKDLAEEVRKGNFRQDLYYRLLGLSIQLPPLRKRSQDVAVLTRHFIKESAKIHGHSKYSLTDTALKKLAGYDYPGNVRELKSVVELACVLAEGDKIDDEQIHFSDLGIRPMFVAEDEMTLKEFNSRLIRSLLQKYNNDVRFVAKQLDIGKSTIYRFLNEDKNL